MIKRTFILERGMLDQHNDRVILSGMKIPEGKMVITQSFKAHLSPVGTGRVFLEDGVLKCEAELDESFITHYPSIGFKPIRANDNKFGGVDMQECELISLAVSPLPNMDTEIKRICDQRQIIKCSRAAEYCFNNCDHMDDRTKCPHATIKCNG